MPAAGRFRPSRRLIRPRQFRRVFEQPCRSVDRWFTILYRPNHMPYSRLGLAITRKRVPGAVARHRVKRQVRESFRLHQEVLRGFDLIVLARTGLQAHANRHLRASLEWHWRQIEGKRCNDS